MRLFGPRAKASIPQLIRLSPSLWDALEQASLLSDRSFKSGRFRSEYIPYSESTCS